jgi:hypothetical protein
MAAEIARELFTQLAAEGLANDATFHAAIEIAYRRESQHALRRSSGLALINDLPVDTSAEASLVDTFAQQLAPAPSSGRE